MNTVINKYAVNANFFNEFKKTKIEWVSHFQVNTFSVYAATNAIFVLCCTKDILLLMERGKI